MIHAILLPQYENLTLLLGQILKRLFGYQSFPGHHTFVLASRLFHQVIESDDDTRLVLLQMTVDDPEGDRPHPTEEPGISTKLPYILIGNESCLTCEVSAIKVRPFKVLVNPPFNPSDEPIPGCQIECVATELRQQAEVGIILITFHRSASLPYTEFYMRESWVP